jgi:hypothetical protein
LKNNDKNVSLTKVPLLLSIVVCAEREREEEEERSSVALLNDAMTHSLSRPSLSPELGRISNYLSHRNYHHSKK